MPSRLGGSLGGQNAPALDDKVRFLSRLQTYPGTVGPVITRETHMSWVFMAGERAYKLKKPVPYGQKIKSARKPGSYLLPV